MKLRTGLPLFLLLAALFLVANRGAYKGYFSDDELDNISWAPRVEPQVYAERLLTPKFQPGNFRPVGHLYFALAGQQFGMDFPKYIFPIHAIHLLNVWLMWLLVRRLGGTPFGAGAAAVLFAFHMAVFDVLWKPMYVFDLLCGTFSLACLLFWTQGRWVLSFAAFWLAYKSKELAVMLPFVLACYEYWLGKRRWKPIIPFAAVSFSFGLQAMLSNMHRPKDDYAMRFNAHALKMTSSFYRDRILLLPFAGLVLPAVPAVVRDRRVWFGIATLFLFFAPLAFLSGRLFSAYCYVPLIGAAIALSGIADHGHRLFVTIFLLFWIPFNFMHLRLNRRQELAIADENRKYVAALADFTRGAPAMRQFIYDGRPFNLRPWGIEGALKYLYRTQDLRVAGADDTGAHEMLRGAEPVAVLSWDPAQARLTATARRDGMREAAYIKMDRTTPIWQLDEGWFALEGGFRWTKPVATARLRRPEGAPRFAVTVNVSPDMVREAGGTEVRVLLDGEAIGSERFTTNGWQTAVWDIKPGPAGTVAVRIESQPYKSGSDPRVLGNAIVGFGFIQ